MAARYTRRKIELFSLHGHVRRRTLDYAAALEALARRRPEERVRELPDQVIVIPTIEIDGDLVFLVVYEGDPRQSTLVFNQITAQERIQRLQRGEFAATKTHVLIDTATREAYVEYTHRGAKATDIGPAVADIASRLLQKYRGTQLTFAPVVDATFLEAIDQLDRIRLASMRVVRPNQDWSDHYERMLALGSDSDARTVLVEATAPRGESLRKRAGLLEVIRQTVGGSLSSILNARVVGQQKGSGQEQAISLRKYVEHRWARVRLREDGQVAQDDIEARMRRYRRDRINGKTN